MKQAAIFVVISAIWYFLTELYPDFLLPLDSALVDLFGHSTVWVLDLAGFEARFDTVIDKIFFNKKEVLHIGTTCNARDLFAFHVFFFVGFHAFLGKPKFLLGGMFLILGLNILRLAFLSLIFDSYGAKGYFDFNHHVLFPVLVYSALFLLWEKSLGKNTLSFWSYALIISLLIAILMVGESRYKIDSILSDFFAQNQIPNLGGGLDTFLLSFFYGALVWAMLALYFWKNTLVQKRFFWGIAGLWIGMLVFTLFYKLLNISILHFISENLIHSFFSPYLLLILFVWGNWQTLKR